MHAPLTTLSLLYPTHRNESPKEKLFHPAGCTGTVSLVGLMSTANFVLPARRAPGLINYVLPKGVFFNTSILLFNKLNLLDT